MAEPTPLTRRSLVAAAPAAIVAASVPTIAACAHPDAALLALRVPFDRTWLAYKRALDAYSPIEAKCWQRHRNEPESRHAVIDDEEGLTAANAVVDETEAANQEIVEVMCWIPARTIDGLAFKARVSLEHEDNRFEELVTSIMDDILAMSKGGLDA